MPPVESPCQHDPEYPRLAESVLLLMALGLTGLICWLLYRPMLLRMAEELLGKAR